MESVLGRYRNLIILVGVLFLQVLGLAVQVKRGPNAENTRLIRIWAVGAITPLERTVVRVQRAGNDLWRNYFYLRGVRAENRQLKEQIEQMRLEEVRLSQDAAQAQRLQSLLAFKEQYIARTLPAQVIGSGGSDLSRSIYIDKGSNDGVAPDMAVITANGIVGKVLRVYPSTSLILMINDQSSGVGALLEKSRLQGVLRGTANGEVMLERVMSDESVVPGEAVLSSGGDGIFPKGLPVGTVGKVSPGREMFLNIKIKPSADLSRLEEVLVVTEKKERQPVADSGARVRAADVLALRLPSVPDKPATPAAAANAGASVTSQPGTKPPGSAPSQPATVKPSGEAALSAPKTSAPAATTNNGAGTTGGNAATAGSGTDAAKKLSPKPSVNTAAASAGMAGTNPAANKPPTSPNKPADTSVTKPAASAAKAGQNPAASPAQPSSPKTGNSASNPQPPPADDNPH